MFFEKFDKRNIILLCLGVVFLVVFFVFLVTNETSNVKLDNKNKSQIKTKTNSGKDSNVKVKEKKKSEDTKKDSDSSTEGGATSNKSTSDVSSSDVISNTDSSFFGDKQTQEYVIEDDSDDVSVENDSDNVAVKDSNSDEGVDEGIVDNNISIVSENAANDTNQVADDVSQTIEETTITLAPSTKRLNVGDKFVFKLIVTPKNASIGTVSYQSNKPSIVSVNKNGTVIAKKEGTAIITAQLSSGRLSTAVVKVIGDGSTNGTKSKNQTANKNSSASASKKNNKKTKKNNSTAKNQTTNKNGSTAVSKKNNKKTKKNNSTTKDQTTNNDSSTANNDQSSNGVSDSNNNQSSTKRDGWINQSGNKYYFKNGQYVTGWQNIDGATYYFNAKGLMLRDTYVDYHYLRPNGKKKNKIGPFSATMYGATAWVKQKLNVHSKVSSESSIDGTVKAGDKVKILSVVHPNGYVKIRSGNLEGYVIANSLMINLPDVIPDMYYEITNAGGSIFKSAGYSISGVTGNNLYGFEKKYNAKIGKTTYYAPMLYPVAVQLQQAYDKAKSQGYNFKVYDTYRPYDVSVNVASQMSKLYNSNTKVRSKVDYDANGGYWGQGWFIAQGVSGHNRGTDIDLALTNANGKELKAQSVMHTLDTSSLVKYNNKVSNKLRSIMTSVGFETLKSEWWHFQEDDYKNSSYVSFKLR